MLITLVSCKNEAANYFEYTSKDMNAVGRLIMLMHKWIGSYGWTVVVFTVFLKIVMLPLDFWQRYSSRKSTLKMQRIQPLLEGIDKRYGANTQRANEEKQKLYKKQGYSVLATCLPMILSMVIFFVMFAGLRQYSQYCTVQTFESLTVEYYDSLEKQYLAMGGDVAATYQAEYDKRYEAKLSALGNSDNKDEQARREAYADLEGKVYAVKLIDRTIGEQAEAKALKAVQEKYKEERESWLWIKNVWQPDTWATVMPDYNKGQNRFVYAVSLDGFPDNAGELTYNRIRNAVLEVDGYGKNGTWNGLMILPVLSIGLSFLSMFISQRIERKTRKGEVQPAPTATSQQQQATNKVMMFMMPAMMAVFGFMYTGAFAIYMVANYTLSIISTIALRWPVEKMVEKNLAKGEKKDKNTKASYMR